MKRATAFMVVVWMIFSGVVIIVPLTGDNVRAAAPSLTITGIMGTSGTITVHYTTADADGDELATCEWQYALDGTTWRDIDDGAIGNNDTKLPGESSITWDTTTGENNILGQEDSSVWFRMKVTDGSTISDHSTTGPFPVDNEPPSPPKSLAGSPGSWSNMNSFTVSWSNPSDISGIGSAYYKLDDPPVFDTDGIRISGSEIDQISGITVPGPGSYQVYVWLEDTQGNMNHSYRTFTILYYDNSRPQSFIPLADPEGWTSDTQPAISFSTTDTLSGIDHYEIKIDDGSFFTQISPYTLPPQDDGKHTMIIKAVDKAGNFIENIVSVHIDTIQPTTFLPTADPNGWTSNTRPTVTFETTDILSGVDNYEVKIDDGVFSSQTSPYILPQQEDGTHLITVKAVDEAGNSMEGTVEVFIDTTPPGDFTPTADPGGNTNNVRPTITFSTDDAASGVDHYAVRIDDGAFIEQTSPYRLPPQDDGVHSITVRAFDRAGNHRDGEVEVNISAVRPFVNFLSPGEGEWVNILNIEISWEGNSPQGDIEKYEVAIDDGSFEDVGLNTSYTAHFDDDDLHVVTVRITDAAGNVGEYDLEIHIDVTGPILNFTSPGDGSVLDKKDVKITWNASDRGIGISGFQIRYGTGDYEDIGNVVSHTFNGPGDGTYTVFLKGIDKLGNEREISLEFSIEATEDGGTAGEGGGEGERYFFHSQPWITVIGVSILFIMVGLLVLLKKRGAKKHIGVSADTPEVPVLDRDTARRIEIWLLKGVIYSTNGEFSKALEAYEKAIDLYPDNPNAWYLKGVTYAAMGNKKKAARSISRTVVPGKDGSSIPRVEVPAATIIRDTTEGEQIRTLLKKGIDHAIEENHNMALKAYDRVIAKDRDNVFAWYLKAITYNAMGSPKVARQCLKESLWVRKRIRTRGEPVEMEEEMEEENGEKVRDMEGYEDDAGSPTPPSSPGGKLARDPAYRDHLSGISLREVSPTIRDSIPGHTLTHKIRSGGFATVYRAEDRSGHAVAIKIPKYQDETLGTSVVRKFRSEVEIWKRLRHKNIVKFDTSDTTPLPYLVMELMEGGSLRDLMEQHRLTIGESVDIMLQVLNAMAYAHKMASVHRDIKPKNILFTRDGILKISDWGIGKFMASGHFTKSVDSKGTLSYSAPEQIGRAEYGDVDWSTDIFQLGILFYEMLTDVNPFHEENLAGILGKILYEKVPPPSTVNPEVPQVLDDIVMKALQKQKQDRWSSAEIMYYKLRTLVER